MALTVKVKFDSIQSLHSLAAFENETPWDRLEFFFFFLQEGGGGLGGGGEGGSWGGGSEWEESKSSDVNDR